MLALAKHYWSLIRGAKNWFAFTTCLFLCGCLAGVVMGITKPGLAESVLDRLLDGDAGGASGFEDAILILTNNLLITFVSWCGSLVLGLLPLYKILSNGFVLGGIFVESRQEIPAFQFFLTLFPHGIVEVPAIFLSNTFFLRLGVRWAFQKNGADRKRTFVIDFKDSFEVALLCVLLFFIAAIIESFATPKIVDAFYPKPKAQGVQQCAPAHGRGAGTLRP